MTSELLPTTEGFFLAAGCAASNDEHPKVVRTLYRPEGIDGRCMRREEWSGLAVCAKWMLRS